MDNKYIEQDKAEFEIYNALDENRRVWDAICVNMSNTVIYELPDFNLCAFLNVIIEILMVF